MHGSAEALSNAILKIQHDEVKPDIVLSSVGAITETDVSLAKASNAVLIGFNIKPNKEAKDLAVKLGVNVLYFNIIYEAIEHITKALSGLLAPEINEQVLGQCEILQVFKSSKAGKVAGIKVTEGAIVNNSDVRIVRDGSVVFTGKIASLYREKNEVKEIKAGIEGGVAFKDFLDFKEKDIIEVFSVVQSVQVAEAMHNSTVILLLFPPGCQATTSRTARSLARFHLIDTYKAMRTRINGARA